MRCFILTILPWISRVSRDWGAGVNGELLAVSSWLLAWGLERRGCLDALGSRLRLNGGRPDETWSFLTERSQLRGFGFGVSGLRCGFRAVAGLLGFDEGGASSVEA